MLAARKAPLLCIAVLAALRLTGQPLIFSRLSVNDGLPGNEVMALHEDREGTIWIGTTTGLARHEGVRVRTWHHDRKDPRSIPNNAIWDIAEDDQGTIWIATDHGLCAYDALRGDFQRVYVTHVYHDATSANRVHAIAPDGNGLLWLSTEDGIHAVDTRTRASAALPVTSPRLQRKPLELALRADSVLHGLWISVPTGVVFYDARARRLIERPTPEFPFPCLNDTNAVGTTPDPLGGVLWLSTSDFRLHGVDARGTVTLDERIATEPAEGTIQFMARDRDGRLWVSRWTHDLSIRSPSEGWMPVEHDPSAPWSISDANAKCWMQDSRGRIWVGTTNGINLLDPNDAGIAAWELPLSASNRILCLTASNGSRIVGTGSEGLFVLGAGSTESRHITIDGRGSGALMPSDVVITAIAPWRGAWLIGTSHGLMRWDGRSDAVTGHTPLVDSLGASYTVLVTFIEPMSDELAWIGTWNRSLHELRPVGPAVKQRIFHGERLPSNMTLSFARDARSQWIGFNNGLGAVRIANDRITDWILHEPDSTGANYGVVRSLALHPDGTLYIGTLMGGLGVRAPHDGSISWLTRSDGLSGDRIEQLLLDPAGVLWIRTNEGLSRLDPRTHDLRLVELPRALAAQGPITAIATDGDGSLLCGVGRYVLDIPVGWSTAQAGTEVLLTGLQFNGHRFATWPTDSTITLPHDQRALSVEIGTHARFGGQRLRFAYRLEGSDTTWRDMDGNTRLDLDDLPTGDQVLAIRASGGGNRWSARPLRLRLHVLPPFWATWWFATSVALAGVLLAWLLIRAYVGRRLRHQRERFERERAVLRERERIASDMHDDLGAGLSALKLRSEMALRVEQDPAKRHQLASMASGAGELIGSMRQIIWAMNADQVSLEDLVVYATSYARQYCEQNGLRLELQLDEAWPSVRLSAEQRRNVFLILKEALHNVVKHAQAGEVRISMRWHQGLLMRVSDNGKGAPAAAERGSGNGLRNMRKRAAAIGGELDIRSEEGTVIELRVPLHANEGSIAGPGAPGEI